MTVVKFFTSEQIAPQKVENAALCASLYLQNVLMVESDEHTEEGPVLSQKTATLKVGGDL